MQNQRQADLWKILQSMVRFRLVLASNDFLGCVVDRILLAFLLIFFYSQKQRSQDSRRISSGSCTSLSSPDISWYCTSCLLFLFFLGYICSSRLAITMKLCTRRGPIGLSNTRKPQSDWICMGSASDRTPRHRQTAHIKTSFRFLVTIRVLSIRV